VISDYNRKKIAEAKQQTHKVAPARKTPTDYGSAISSTTSGGK